MPDDPESFVTIEIREVIHSIAKEKGISDYRLSAFSGTTLGDNYLGEIISVVVKGSNEKGEDNVLNLILKCAPRSEIFRELINMGNIYDREIYLYEKVFKEFQNIQIENGIRRPFYPFAICHKTIPDDGIETLVMENMKKLGFDLQDRRKPLNYDHVLLTMKSYGRVHALSLAIKDKHPELFRELADNLQERFVVGTPYEYVMKATEEAYDCLDGLLKEKLGAFRSNLLEILAKELGEQAAGKYAVIVHGDSWTNNILFKYGDTALPEKPTELIFLDWQLSHVGSPVTDLSYFIFACTNKDLRDKHYRTLMDEYYESLASSLRTLGSDPDLLYPREVFEEHLKKYLGLGVYMSIAVLKLMLSEKDEIPDFKNMTETELKNTDYKFEITAKNYYQERVKEIIGDCIEYGYVEFNK